MILLLSPDHVPPFGTPPSSLFCISLSFATCREQMERKAHMPQNYVAGGGDITHGFFFISSTL